MIFILILTGKCNLNFKYCGGSIDEGIMPHDVTCNLRDLTDFLNSFKDVSIAFYDGEPLLRMDLIKKIMDDVNAEHLSFRQMD